MKKISILLTLILAGSIIFGQALISENFENYPLGKFEKQRGWEREGGNPDQIKIVNLPNQTNGKSLQFDRSTLDEIGLHKALPWSSRSPGNNILKVDFKIFSGRGFGKSGIQVFADGITRYKVGELVYFASSGSFLFRSQNMDPNGTITFSNVEENRWYDCTMTYNSNNGQSYIVIEGATFGPFSDAAGKSPDRFQFTSDPFDGLHTLNFDDLKVSAINQLSASTENGISQTTVFPNPANDLFTIKTDKGISQVFLFDHDGRMVASSNSKAMNLSGLNSGIYILNIKYTDGKHESMKIIKK